VNSSWARPRTLLSALALCLAASLAAVLPTAGGAAASPTIPTTISAERATDRQLAGDQARLPKRCGTNKHPLIGCRVKWYGPQAPTVVVWGDSHAWMMTPAVVKAAVAKRANVVLFSLGGCVPSIPNRKLYAGNDCARVSYAAMDYVQYLRDHGRRYRVLLGSFWGANLNRLYWYETREREQIQQEHREFTLKYTPPLFRWLGQENIPTDVAVQGPASVPPSDCGLGTWPFWCPVPRAHAYYKDTYVRNWLKRQMTSLDRGSRLVDYSDGICSNHSCPAVVNGVHTWFDPYHVSATKAKKLTRYFKPVVRKALRHR